MWRKEDTGDAYEPPVDDLKPGEGDGWREGVEAGAVRRLQN